MKSCSLNKDQKYNSWQFIILCFKICSWKNEVYVNSGVLVKKNIVEPKYYYFVSNKL